MATFKSINIKIIVYKTIDYYKFDIRFIYMYLLLIAITVFESEKAYREGVQQSALLTN